MPTILGVNFLGLEALEKQGPKHLRGKNRRKGFAEKFVGNPPKICQTQIENSTQARSAEPRDQKKLRK